MFNLQKIKMMLCQAEFVKNKNRRYILLFLMAVLSVFGCKNPNIGTTEITENKTDTYKEYLEEVLVSNAQRDYYALFDTDFDYTDYTLIEGNQIFDWIKKSGMRTNKNISGLLENKDIFGILFDGANTIDLGSSSKKNYQVLYLKRGEFDGNSFVGGGLFMVDDFGYPCPDGITCERCTCGGGYRVCFWVCMSESGDNCGGCD